MKEVLFFELFVILFIIHEEMKLIYNLGTV